MRKATGRIVVSGLRYTDLTEVVAVHVSSFRGFFLSQLGPRFLRCLYEEILKDPSGISLVSKQDQRVTGFVVGTAEPRGFYKKLLVRKWHRFAISSVVPVLRNPSVVPRLLNAFEKSNEEPNDEGCGLLMSLAVDPQFQMSGVGVALAEGFLIEARKRGLTAVHLTTDRFDNDRVNRFYARLGFDVSRVITTDQGRVMNDYRIKIG